MGVLSMIVLARLLTPADFGVVATCTLVAFFLDAVVNLGTRQYIITIEEVNDTHLNTAWTINLTIKIVMFLVILASSSQIAVFLDKPEIRLPLCVLATVFPISALGTPGILIFLRNLNYRPSFIIELQSKIVATAVTITLALIFRSYWALIAGTVVSYALPALLTYKYSDYRPAFCIQNARQQLNFSKWMLLSGTVGFARSEADTLVATKTFSIEGLGIYSMFRNVASILSIQVIQPALDPLLATFSETHRSGGISNYQVNAVLLIASMALMPLSAWILIYCNEIVLYLLGNQWVQHAGTLGTLSLGIFPAILQTVISTVIIAKGGIGFLSRFGMFTAVLAITLLASFSYRGQTPEDFAALHLLVSVLFVSLLLMVCTRRFHTFHARDLALIISPTLPACAAAVVVAQVFEAVPTTTPLAFVDFCVQSATYWILVVLATALLLYLLRKNAALGLLLKVLNEIGEKSSFYQRIKTRTLERSSSNP